MCRYSILAVGGDLRQAYAANELYKMGYDVYAYAVPRRTDENIKIINSPSDTDKKFDIIFLPMMMGQDMEIPTPFFPKVVAAKDLEPLAEKNALVCGGMFKTPLIEHFSALGFDVYDYFRREELILKNCIPTAEGALQIALERTLFTVRDSKVLVTGFGRVAKVTAMLFKSVGAEVFVCDRKNDSFAEILGFKRFNINELSKHIQNFDIIINTVPAPVLLPPQLILVKPDALIIDLASKPGGVDFEFAKQRGINTVHALSIPGKTAPVTAGKYIAQTIHNIILTKRGDKYERT